LFILALLVICAQSSGVGPTHEGGLAGEARAIVCAYADMAPRRGENAIYAASFKAAWDKLANDVVGAPILLANPASRFAHKMNEQKLDWRDLAQGSVVAWAGKPDAMAIDSLNEYMWQQFGRRVQILEARKSHETPRCFAAYAYLEKKIRFIAKFEEIKSGIPFNSLGNEAGYDGDKRRHVSNWVEAFGIEAIGRRKRKEVGPEVRVNRMGTGHGFAVKICGEAGMDEIVLAKTDPERTLLATWRKVKYRSEHEAWSAPQEGSRLAIPKIRFKVRDEFPAIRGAYLLNEGWQDWWLSAAVQVTSFDMNEQGVALKSEAVIEIEQDLDNTDRSYVFDSPFLLALKLAGKHEPYMLLWVANTKIMIEVMK